MWIPKAISEAGSETPFAAAVIFSDGKTLTLGGDHIGMSAEAFLPYGVESVPPEGEKTAVVPAGRTLCCVGVEAKRVHSLEPGEIALYSKGGASIILKNDGRVIINGHVFREGGN